MLEVVWVLKTSNLALKELLDVLKTKNPTKEQIREHTITERELFEKSDNLSEKELNTKSNKTVYVRNDVITTVIKCYRGEKKRHASNRWILKRKKKSRFWNFCVSRIWSQIKNRKTVYEWKNPWRIFC